MLKIQVLIATMHQEDYNLLEKMNIQTDAVVINQCDQEAYNEFLYQGHTIIWINTKQRGLSKSRNMALSYATGDICLIADDDLVYNDGYEKEVKNAFERCNKADIIAFGINRVYQTHTTIDAAKRERRAPKNKYYSSVKLAFLRKSIVKTGLFFNTFIGAGTPYGSGEESLFLRNARKKRLVIYETDKVLSVVSFLNSTWFKGYDEGYYFNKGVFLAAAYGRLAGLYKWYFIIQSRKISKLKWTQVNKCLKEGIKKYFDL